MIVLTNFNVGVLSDRTLIRDLAHVILAHDHFARDDAGRLFHYSDGVYVDYADFYVKQQVKQLTIKFGNPGRWNRALAHEVIEYITLDAPEILKSPDVDRINLVNGILNFWTGELIPHSPSFLSPLRIPITYDAKASCGHVEEFINQVFPTDSIELAWEVVADLLTADRSIQKAICLVGEGGNGKSVFCQFCTNFIGEHNVVHLSLQKLESDRFAPARLFGKLANICPDIPGTRTEDSAVFKAIVGGDRITGEIKYRDPFEFRPFARLIFSANHFPVAQSGSRAYFDRWLLIPFERRFRGSKFDVPRSALDAKLNAPSALSAALNRALPALRRLRTQNRFTETRSTNRINTEFQMTSDPFRAWLQEETISNLSSSITQSALHQAYEMARLRANQAPITKQMFGRVLKRHCPDIREFQKTIDGIRQWMYGGIALRRRNSNHSIENTNHSVML